MCCGRVKQCPNGWFVVSLRNAADHSRQPLPTQAISFILLPTNLRNTSLPDLLHHHRLPLYSMGNRLSISNILLRYSTGTLLG